MILLLAFAFLAGAATAITPCVLPVLPALLSASGTGGRRRPVGDRPRADAHARDHDRRRRLGRRRRRRRRRHAADGRDRRAARCSGSRCSCRARPSGSTLRLSFLQRLGAAPRRRRLLVGPAGRRRAGLRLRAVRRADPRRGDLRQRVVGHDRRRSSPSRSPTALGSAVVLLGLALGGRRVIDRVRRTGRGGVAAARLRRGHGADRGAHVHERRPALPGGAGQPLPVVSDQPDRRRWRSPPPSRTSSPTCAASRSSTTTVVAGDRARRRRRASDAALPGVQTPDAAGARRRARVRRARQRWFNSPPLTMAGAARPRRARRLLDVHLHQLPAHAALPQGVGRALPRRRG